MKKIILAILVMTVLCSFYIYAQELTEEERKEEIERIKQLSSEDLAKEILEGTIRISYTEINPSQLAGAIDKNSLVIQKLDDFALGRAVKSDVEVLKKDEVFNLYDARAQTNIALLDDDDIMQIWAEKKGIKVEKWARLTRYTGTTFSTAKVINFNFVETKERYDIKLLRDGDIEISGVGIFTGFVTGNPRTGEITTGGMDATFTNPNGDKISCSKLGCDITSKAPEKRVGPDIEGWAEITTKAGKKISVQHVKDVKIIRNVIEAVVKEPTSELMSIINDRNLKSEHRVVFDGDMGAYEGKDIYFYDKNYKEYARLEEGATRIEDSKEGCAEWVVSCIVANWVAQTTFIRARGDSQIAAIKSNVYFKQDLDLIYDESKVSILREYDEKLLAGYDNEGLHPRVDPVGLQGVAYKYKTAAGKIVAQSCTAYGCSQCVGDECKEDLLKYTPPVPAAPVRRPPRP